jgi:hypothetical protein
MAVDGAHEKQIRLEGDLDRNVLVGIVLRDNEPTLVPQRHDGGLVRQFEEADDEL